MHNGNYLEIEREIIAIEEKISFEFYSPYIDNTEVILASKSVNPLGEFSLPFSIKGNKAFDRIVKGLQLLSANSRLYRLENVRLFSDGKRIDIGFVEVKTITTNLDTNINDYKCTAFFKMTDYMDAIRDKKVNELLMSGVKQIPKGRPTEFREGDFTDVTQTLRVRSLKYKNTGGIWNFISPPDAANGSFGYQGQGAYEQGLSNAYFASQTFDPFPMDELFATHKWAKEVVDGAHDSDYICFPTFAALKQALNDTDNEETVLSNIRICNHWEAYRNRFYAYSRGDAYFSGSNAAAYQDPGVMDGTLAATVDNYVSYETPIVPCYYYHQVLRHCFSEFGYELQGDVFIDSEQFRKKYLLNTYNISKELNFKVVDLFQGTPGHVSDTTPDFNPAILVMQDDTEVNPKNHLPDMKISEFLQDFQKHFCCIFRFRGKKVFIEYNELEKVQREISKIHPQVVIDRKEADNKGVRVFYDLSNDSAYERYAPFALTEEYNSGKNDRELKLPPAYNKLLKYGNPLSMPPYINRYGFDLSSNLLPDLQSGVFVSKNLLLPFTMKTVCGRMPDTYTWRWTSQTWEGGAASPPEHWSFDNFEIDDVELQEDIASGGVHSVAFYYGMHNWGLTTPPPGGTTPAFNFEIPSTVSENVFDGVAMATWDLGITTPGGVIKRFWRRSFTNIFDIGEKIIVSPHEGWYDIVSHKYNQSVMIMGLRMYVGAMIFEMPDTELPSYECYRIE